MPAFPDVNIPSLGDFQIPPPPPSPPVQSTWLGRSVDWVGRNPWKTSGIAVGVVGASLLVGYTTAAQKGRRHLYKVKTQSSERKQVVGTCLYSCCVYAFTRLTLTVVLGGDTPYALPLIIDLEKKGYIVITSASTTDAAEDIERKCHGYVRALVLDPYEVFSCMCRLHVRLIYILHLAWNCPCFLAFIDLDSVSQVSYQRFWRSIRFSGDSSLHPFRHISTHSFHISCGTSSSGAYQPPYQLPAIFECNSDRTSSSYSSSSTPSAHRPG
jgi:hypothetical protein